MPANCPHDHRPGTTICLHCRHDERMAARARVRAHLARGGAAAIVLALGVAVSVAGAGAIQKRGVFARGARPAEVPVVEHRVAGGPPHYEVAQAGTPMPNPTTAASTDPLPALIVAEGRTELRDSLWVERSGSTVRVHFDTPDTRTRRRDKFEAVVRATLPAVYGPAADSALTRLAPGAIVGNVDVVSELPTRGARIAMKDGSAITIWPETRPGRDGPLVVSYRAALGR